MVSFTFEKTGWLNRYLLYRASTPFEPTEPYRKLAAGKIGEKSFDDCLYAEVKENGMLLGTLFSVAMIENQTLTSAAQNDSSDTYQLRLLNVVMLVLKYHFPHSYYRIPQDVPLTELLEQNESLNGALSQLEEAIIDYVTLQGYSSLGNRQNIFSFSKLYFFLLWAREKSRNDAAGPARYIEMDKQLREEMIIAFAALIWADDHVDSTEQQVFEKYIDQTGLEESKKNQLARQFLKPVKTADVTCSFTASVISGYLIEQLILLSLIDNQEAWQERELIENISNKLGLSFEDLEELYFSVAEFFSVHNERLEFLKNNAAAQQFQDYMNDKVVKLVKKNVDNIMQEIEETKELSELLVKATTTPLTKEEKQKVQDQLMDIAKSIPALAIFALPGGGILLPILIKVLPFNILPSSFQEEPTTN